MRMLMLGLLVLPLLMAGCAGRRAELAIHDLGVGSPAFPVAALGRMEIHGPSWLSSSAMHYRLTSAPTRRHVFAETRWAGPPPELLEASLRQRLTGAGQCRLRLDLEEFIQVFDAEGESRVRLELGATLLAPRGTEVLRARHFELERPGGRDAVSGAAAFALLSGRLAEEIGRWLGDAGPPCIR